MFRFKTGGLNELIHILRSWKYFKHTWHKESQQHTFTVFQPRLSLAELHPLEGTIASMLTADMWGDLRDGEGRIIDKQYVLKVSGEVGEGGRSREGEREEERERVRERERGRGRERGREKERKRERGRERERLSHVAPCCTYMVNTLITCQMFNTCSCKSIKLLIKVSKFPLGQRHVYISGLHIRVFFTLASMCVFCTCICIGVLVKKTCTHLLSRLTR